jgi:ATP-dependent RNA helicase DDX54/DBP10
MGVTTEAIYGSMEQTTRTGNLAKFRLRKCRVLVVTDVASRGIDVPLLDNVVNFDCPDKPKLFVHR